MADFDGIGDLFGAFFELIAAFCTMSGRAAAWFFGILFVILISFLVYLGVRDKPEPIVEPKPLVAVGNPDKAQCEYSGGKFNCYIILPNGTKASVSSANFTVSDVELKPESE